MSRRKMILAGIATVILATFIVLSNLQLVPACTDPEVAAQAAQILGKQFKVQSKLSLHNIRVLSGGLFADRWECQAEVRGREGAPPLPNVKSKEVVYTSQLATDTHRLHVTVRMVPPR